MRELSLFSGAGGGLLGTKLLGWQTVGYVEFNEYCQKVLKQRILDGIFDEAPIFGDIRNLTLSMLDYSVNYSYNCINAMEDSMSAKRKDYNEAIKMYNMGLSIQQVADYYVISRQAMHLILKRRGVNFRPQKKYGEDNHFYRGGSIAHDRSQNLVESAIDKGILKRKIICDKCGNTGVFKDGRSAIQAHHNDYNKPLDIKWLCQKCHHEWHKNNKPIKFNGEKLEAAGQIDVVSGGFP